MNANVRVTNGSTSLRRGVHLRSPKVDVTSTTAQTIIHRLSGSRISAVISVLVLTVAVFTLYRLVRDVDLAKVVAALERSRSNKSPSPPRSSSPAILP
jgi:hypothetical protein